MRVIQFNTFQMALALDPVHVVALMIPFPDAVAQTDKVFADWGLRRSSPVTRSHG
jgi:hypothetical protein